jgi:membrane associated rhomboid family serine protease
MFLAIPTEIDDGSSRRTIPTATGLIVAVNIVLFLLGYQMPVGPRSGLLSIVGYGLTHASIAHLVVNMWVLLVVGSAVNRRIGNGYFVLLYFGTIATLGIFARLTARQYLVGSSGGIFAVIAVMTLLLPSARARISYVALFPVTILIGIFLRPSHWLYWLLRWDTVRVRALWLLLVVPMLQLFGLFWRPWNWTNAAHLLGFICGVAFVTLLPEKISMRRYSVAY